MVFPKLSPTAQNILHYSDNFCREIQFFQTLSQTAQDQNMTGLFNTTASLMRAEETILELVPPMAAIHSTLSKTRDGLLIELCRVVKVAVTRRP